MHNEKNTSLPIHGMQDNGINIVSINNYRTEDDIKRNLCGSRKRVEKPDIVHISCTKKKKKELKSLPKIKLEFIEDDG